VAVLTEVAPRCVSFPCRQTSNWRGAKCDNRATGVRPYRRLQLLSCSTRIIIFPKFCGDSRVTHKELTRQELTHRLWNPKVHYRVHNSPSLVPALSHMNPVNILTPYSFQIILILSSHLRVYLSSRLFPSGLSCEMFNECLTPPPPPTIKGSAKCSPALILRWKLVVPCF
jgi:hypothetical protein